MCVLGEGSIPSCRTAGCSGQGLRTAGQGRHECGVEGGRGGVGSESQSKCRIRVA